MSHDELSNLPNYPLASILHYNEDKTRLSSTKENVWQAFPFQRRAASAGEHGHPKSWELKGAEGWAADVVRPLHDFVYLLTTSNPFLYTGIAADLNHRLWHF